MYVVFFRNTFSSIMCALAYVSFYTVSDTTGEPDEG